MLEHFLHAIDQSVVLLKANIMLVVYAIALLWVIHVVNVLLGYRLAFLGVYPRKPVGLIGIPFYSFIHRDFQHVFLNSIPLFILLNVVLLYGVQTAIYATLAIILFAGVAIWLFARKGFHIGASALVFGYFGFVIGGAFFTHDFIAILAAVLCLFYLGGMLAGLIPARDSVSWEGHLLGFITGFFYSYYLLG